MANGQSDGLHADHDMRILVTGASRGLGKVVAEAFSEHEVTAWGRKDADFLESPTTWPPYPDVDAVIHCAGGGLGLRHPMLNSYELYKLFMVNVGGQAEVNRMVLPNMIERKSGYICHVCSIASGEAIGSVGYNTVKAALAAYVRSLGREMATHGIVVSGIAPGAFQCEGNAMERLQANAPIVHRDFIENRLPRGRMGDAKELIPLIRLLTSPAGSMMGGCVVPIDAGEGRYY